MNAGVRVAAKRKRRAGRAAKTKRTAARTEQRRRDAEVMRLIAKGKAVPVPPTPRILGDVETEKSKVVTARPKIWTPGSD